MKFETTYNGDAAVKASEQIAARAADLSRPLDRLGHHHVRKAQRILRAGERGIKARHASGLASSLTHAVQAPYLSVGSNKAYAGIHQRGGIIQPVTSQYLTIPIADNVKGNGDPRIVSPRLVADGFFMRTKEGALLFVRKLTKRVEKRRDYLRGRGARGLGLFREASQRLELLFLLVKEVVMPKRPYVTHDPGDRVIWDQYAADWVLRGK